MCLSLCGQQSWDRRRGDRKLGDVCSVPVRCHRIVPGGLICYCALCCRMSVAICNKCRKGFDIWIMFLRSAVGLYIFNSGHKQSTFSLKQYRYTPMPISWIQYILFCVAGFQHSHRPPCYDHSNIQPHIKRRRTRTNTKVHSFYGSCCSRTASAFCM